MSIDQLTRELKFEILTRIDPIIREADSKTTVGQWIDIQETALTSPCVGELKDRFQSVASSLGIGFAQFVREEVAEVMKGLGYQSDRVSTGTFYKRYKSN